MADDLIPTGAAQRQDWISRPALLIGAAMAVVIAIAVVLGIRSYESIQGLRGSAARAQLTIFTANDVVLSLLQAESAQRGFILTHRADYLGPFSGAVARVNTGLEKLDGLADDAGWLRSLSNGLRGAAKQKIAELERTIELYRTTGDAAAIALINTDVGKAEMETARELATQIVGEAGAERDRRVTELTNREQQTLYGVIAAAVLGTILLGVAALGLQISRTRLARAQAALRLQSTRLAGTVEHLRDGVAVFSADGRLLLSNPTFFTVTGLPAALAAVGTPYAEFERACEAWPTTPLAGPCPALSAAPAEITLGKTTLEVARRPMPDGGQMVAIGDVTRRTQAEAIARQAQKLELLGQLTGGLAHDFNNLLQVVSANLELIAARLTGEMDPNDWFRGRLAAAQGGVERGARLTRHLLAFARRQALAPEPLDPARLLRGMEDMIRRSIGSRIAIEVVTGGGLWAVRADPNQLENAILNLVVNARDAITAKGAPDGGRMTLEAANAFLDQAYADENSEVTPGQYVVIAVTDTGVGMSPAEVARAVDPFYTTKPEGKGTGLGLSMVYGFLKQSGGHFKIYSEPGHGTTVKLYLPRSHAAPREPAPLVPTRSPAEGELVLVVEDDSGVRAAACQALLTLGYRVIEAADAAEGLRIITEGQRPDLLFTDVVMPGPLGARELSARARALLPGLAVVFTSGYTENSIVHNGQLDPDIVLVGKPWGLDELGRRLRYALDRARAEQPAPAQPQRLRVLLTEDDELVRMTTSEMLADMGCDVVQAANGAEALAHARTLAPIDLLVTDIGLPDMDGTRLVTAVRELHPALPVIVASGQAQPIEIERVTWLGKPYDEAALRAALATARATTPAP